MKTRILKKTPNAERRTPNAEWKRRLITLCLIPALAAVALCGGGCGILTKDWNLSATNETGVVTDDQIVIKAEQTLRIALDTFDTFLQLDRANEAFFVKIGAHGFAEKLRKVDSSGKPQGQRWIDSLKAAKQAYKSNRTSLNHANLMTAWQTVQTAINESQKYINKVNNP